MSGRRMRLHYQAADRPTDRPGDQIRAGTNGDCVLHTGAHHGRPGLRIQNLPDSFRHEPACVADRNKDSRESTRLIVTFAQGLSIRKFCDESRYPTRSVPNRTLSRGVGLHGKKPEGYFQFQPWSWEDSLTRRLLFPDMAQAARHALTCMTIQASYGTS